MKTYKEILEEATTKENKIYVDGNKNLWFAYRPYSGQTIANFNTKMFITDKKNDSHYDPTSIKDFIAYAKANKPVKKKGKQSIFPIPVYKGSNQPDFDVWDEGNQKPNKIIYFLLSEGEINIVNFFDSKGEALGWLNSTV